MDNERRYFPSRAMINEPSSPLGDINISLEVIANIVRLLVVDVEGVVCVGGDILRRAEGFIRRPHEIIDGIAVQEDGDGYGVRVRIQVAFGVELSRVAYQVQDTVHENLRSMAKVNVTRVDVVIDGIRKLPLPGESKMDASSKSASSKTVTTK
jgi:uncharacterized alkaline shock family protein YloU